MESWATKKFRWWMNFFPCWRGTGARVTYIAADWKRAEVSLPLNWRTRNYVGTIFGGSIYSAADPFYMLMLIKVLGKDYVVWDKAAAVRFKKPGKSMLRAVFALSDSEIEEIKQLAQKAESIDRTYTIELTDCDGIVCAEVDKTIYIRKK